MGSTFREAGPTTPLARCRQGIRSGMQPLESADQRDRGTKVPFADIAGYFGCTFGSPPGEPGGGITGMRPVSAGGIAMSRSWLSGGQMTPFDCASLSLRVPPDSPLPVVGDPMLGVQATLGGVGVPVAGGSDGTVDCAQAVVTAAPTMADDSNSVRSCRMAFSRFNAVGENAGRVIHVPPAKNTAARVSALRRTIWPA
jgi:hypothetical protein